MASDNTSNDVGKSKQLLSDILFDSSDESLEIVMDRTKKLNFEISPKKSKILTVEELAIKKNFDEIEDFKILTQNTFEKQQRTKIVKKKGLTIRRSKRSLRNTLKSKQNNESVENLACDISTKHKSLQVSPNSDPMNVSSPDYQLNPIMPNVCTSSSSLKRNVDNLDLVMTANPTSQKEMYDLTNTSSNPPSNTSVNLMVETTKIPNVNEEAVVVNIKNSETDKLQMNDLEYIKSPGIIEKQKIINLEDPCIKKYSEICRENSENNYKSISCTSVRNTKLVYSWRKQSLQFKRQLIISRVCN